jgi:translation initiation factor 2 subunit 2
MEYEDMLERGVKKLPESAIEKQRFEVPKAKGHLEGNKTIISNFMQVVDTLGRKSEHVLKFLLRELATPGDVKGGSLILKRKISASKVNEKIQKYADEYVLCSECGKPDTQIIKEKEVSYLKCMACGAKHPIKSFM